MIRKQQLQERAADAFEGVGRSLDLHSGLDQADAGGCVNSLADVHDADAANADGFLILLMAQRGNHDAGSLRSLEDGGRFSTRLLNDHWIPVDG